MATAINTWHSQFIPTGSDGLHEHYFWIIPSDDSDNFSETLESLYERYRDALKRADLSEETLIFARFYVSDIINQNAELSDSKVFRLAKNAALSVVEQCPLETGAKVGMLTYHLKATPTAYLQRRQIDMWADKHQPATLTPYALEVSGRHYGMLWHTNLSSTTTELDSHRQTSDIFSRFKHKLAQNQLTILNSTLRTWIYVRDIDNHYAGMVKARREFFDTEGLIADTRYIASTGIEGKLARASSLVLMDALSYRGIGPRQITQMAALSHLCPTHKYGVTFERGTRLDFGDRSHLYISGTASIDRDGDVLHVSDISGQTRRTLENIQALLAPHGASLQDMSYLIIYLRDHKDTQKVRAVIRKELGEDLPVVIVRGAVCRPEWLIEIEGVAVKSERRSDFEPFL